MSARKKRTRRKKAPRCIIIAGPNGVGKTTLAQEFLRTYAKVVHLPVATCNATCGRRGVVAIAFWSPNEVDTRSDDLDRLSYPPRPVEMAQPIVMPHRKITISIAISSPVTEFMAWATILVMGRKLPGS